MKTIIARITTAVRTKWLAVKKDNPDKDLPMYAAGMADAEAAALAAIRKKPGLYLNEISEVAAMDRSRVRYPLMLRGEVLQQVFYDTRSGCFRNMSHEYVHTHSATFYSLRPVKRGKESDENE